YLYVIVYCYFFFFFFFQAEDGIRDRTVTGVQTCALPIYDHPSPDDHPKKDGHPACPVPAGERAQRVEGSLFAPRTSGEGSELIRSEERRVGKECRSRWVG